MDLSTRDGIVVSGKLDHLIIHLLPTPSSPPEPAFAFAFILNARSFIKPSTLFERVFEESFTRLSSIADFEGQTAMVQNILFLLRLWVEYFPWEFYGNSELLVLLRRVVQRLIESSETHDPESTIKADLSQIMQKLLARHEALQEYEESLIRIHSETAAQLDLLTPNSDLLALCPSPLLLAHQLTLIELERLKYIGPEEFVQSFVSESKTVAANVKDSRRTVNIEAYVQWFNRLSYLVATEICMQTRKKVRLQVIQYLISVAKECFNIGNFNSLMAIFAGLNLGAVQRLRRTWHECASGGGGTLEKMHVLERQVDPANNFQSYRSTLRAALSRAEGATVDERERICIPFFTLFVKDLYFLHVSSSNKLENDQINFEKCIQVANMVSEFMTWKNVNCPFERDARILQYILTTPVFGERALLLASFECEAPDSTDEKLVHKELKTAASEGVQKREHTNTSGGRPRSDIG